MLSSCAEIRLGERSVKRRSPPSSLSIRCEARRRHVRKGFDKFPLPCRLPESKRGESRRIENDLEGKLVQVRRGSRMTRAGEREGGVRALPLTPLASREQEEPVGKGEGGRLGSDLVEGEIEMTEEIKGSAHPKRIDLCKTNLGYGENLPRSTFSQLGFDARVYDDQQSSSAEPVVFLPLSTKTIPGRSDSIQNICRVWESREESSVQRQGQPRRRWSEPLLRIEFSTAERKRNPGQGRRCSGTLQQEKNELKEGLCSRRRLTIPQGNGSFALRREPQFFCELAPPLFHQIPSGDLGSDSTLWSKTFSNSSSTLPLVCSNPLSKTSTESFPSFSHIEGGEGYSGSIWRNWVGQQARGSGERRRQSLKGRKVGGWKSIGIERASEGYDKWMQVGKEDEGLLLRIPRIPPPLLVKQDF